MSLNDIMQDEINLRIGGGRNSSIELLRVLCAMGVVLLHYNNPVAFNEVHPYSGNQVLVCIFETFSVCAVNLFILITGYFLCTNNKRSLGKPLNLIFQVILFRVLFYILSVQIGLSNFTVINLVASFLPCNWFVTLYVALYFISPYINQVVNNLKKEEFNVLLLVILVLFCIWNFFADIVGYFATNTIMGISTIGMYGSQGGCTIINFIMMYILGGYIRLQNFNIPKRKNLLIYIITIAVHFIILFFEANASQGWVRSISMSYLHPLVVLEPVLLFVLFKNISLKSKVINELAKAAFTCFLTQNFFLRICQIDKYVNGNTYILFIHITLTVFGIYLISYLIYKIYFSLTNTLFTKIDQHIVKY